ncbi:hypothetical protein B0H14DRAFT_3436117 [Mycena olivaceomarginata]|nr:hypothetical protein B0H14DRAFT_3436117 [Mycena olivaceomarginata]
MSNAGDHSAPSTNLLNDNTFPLSFLVRPLSFFRPLYISDNLRKQAIMLVQSYTAFPLTLLQHSQVFLVRVLKVLILIFLLSYSPAIYDITNFVWFNLVSHPRELNTNDAGHTQTLYSILRVSGMPDRPAVMLARLLPESTAHATTLACGAEYETDPAANTWWDPQRSAVVPFLPQPLDDELMTCVPTRPRASNRAYYAHGRKKYGRKSPTGRSDPCVRRLGGRLRRDGTRAYHPFTA